MIMQQTKPRALSRTGPRIALVTGAMLLPWLPTWAQQPARDVPANQRVERLEVQEFAEKKVPPVRGAVVVSKDAIRGVASDQDRAQRLEQARDEVELLEASLGVRRAHLSAAKTALEPARENFEPRCQTGGV